MPDRFATRPTRRLPSLRWLASVRWLASLRWLAGLLLVVAACDIPTELPRWDTAWVILAVDDQISTGKLLPNGVSDDLDGFSVDSLSTSRTVRLGDVCELCTCFSGPIPPVELTPQSFALPLPGGVLEAEIVNGDARVVIVNQVTFDLLDNGEGQRGAMIIELFDARQNAVLDSVRIDDPFPPGDSIVLRFDLGNLALHRSMFARVRGSIPGSGCDSVNLAPELGIKANVALSDLRVSEVEILVTDAAVTLPTDNIELPEAVVNRIRVSETRLSLEVELVSRVAVSLEVTLSVARTPEALFTEGAALFTPMLIPPGTPTEPVTVRKTFVLDVGKLEGAETLFINTQSRIQGSRRVTLTGGEDIEYRVWIQAELPIR